MTFETLLRAAVLTCGAYLAVLWIMHWALLAVGLVETRRRRREREVDDVDALSGSRFAPGVSILVPAYNERAALPDAVRSALSIDYPEFEVIVVNDGSTDGSEQIIRRYPFHAISTPNRGVSAARNEGLNAATGEIIAYIDADARADPDWLS